MHKLLLGRVDGIEPTIAEIVPSQINNSWCFIACIGSKETVLKSCHEGCIVAAGHLEVVEIQRVGIIEGNNWELP